jgi:hypothetical protein
MQREIGPTSEMAAAPGPDYLPNNRHVRECNTMFRKIGLAAMMVTLTLVGSIGLATVERGLVQHSHAWGYVQQTGVQG